MHKTFSIKTLGCKLNQHESSLIVNQFTRHGWKLKPFGEMADVVIINTCTVTDKSDKKCRNYIRQGAKFSGTGTSVITGCMAESVGDSLLAMEEAGLVLRNSDKDDIFNRVCEFLNTPVQEEVLHLSEVDLTGGASRTRASLKVQDGCDGSCTYCIVPSVRGLPVSRPVYEVVEDARSLIDRGYPELVLTGVTIGKYYSDNNDLAELLERLLGLDGDFRVRVTSIEPNHVTDRLVQLFDSEKLCNHIHLPLQSGSAAILQKMKRPYTPLEFMSVVDMIRKKNPLIAIGSDVILGFPGEGEEQFMESMDMIERARFAYVHQFTFSPRRGTPAALMEQTSSPAEVAERAGRMKDLASKVGLEYRKNFEGRELSAVIERGAVSYTHLRAHET